MTYEEKRALYESTMQHIAKELKKMLNESDDSVFIETEKIKGSFLSHTSVEKKFQGQHIAAYNPKVKGDPNAKDWNMYAVRISDIKEASAAYYGYNEGWPSYFISHISLWGKISFIKAGNGQNWEMSFPGRLEISYDERNKSFVFKPYQFEGKFSEMTPRSSGEYVHFADRCVYVPVSDFAREVNAEEKQKELIELLSKGYRSDNIVKYLLQNNYLKIVDGELKPAKEDIRESIMRDVNKIIAERLKDVL